MDDNCDRGVGGGRKLEVKWVGTLLQAGEERAESRNSKMVGTGTNKVKIFQQYIILQQGNHQERW